MIVEKLEKWTELLLDTSRSSYLINFRDRRTSTLEVLLPSAESLFDQIDKTTSLEVYDPGIIDETELEEFIKNNENESEDSAQRHRKKWYYDLHSHKITRNDQILIYSTAKNPLTTVNNINRRSRESIEETGVNVTHLTFGFVHWKESEASSRISRAPLLLVPITIERESAIHPYIIRTDKDELIINPTFSHKLAEEYGIILPAYDDEGLKAYLESVREIVSQLGWSVSSDCRIGFFSFQKINMYRDIKDNFSSILKNRNMRQLLGEAQDSEAEWSSGNGNSANEITNPLIELHSVIDADSSQIDAIQMAKSGQSFVLQGPPGTGKSQTITNIIAECLYDGKKVLFVSEKMAALNVVYDKLNQVGLSEFCLELHSSKANKKSFINELCETLEKDRSAVSASANKVIAQKEIAQSQLDTYASELHMVRPVINKNLYSLYEDFASYRTIPHVNWPIPQLTKRGEEHLFEISSLLNQYVDYIPSIGYDYRKNPWYGYIKQDSSYQTKSEVKADIGKGVLFFTEILPVISQISKEFDVDCKNIDDVNSWLDFFKFASTTKILTADLLDKDSFRRVYSGIEDVKTACGSILASKESICSRYNVEVLDLDGEEYNNKLLQNYQNVLKRMFSSEYKQIINEIRLNKKDGSRINYLEALEITQAISKYHRKLQDYKKAIEPMLTILGEVVQGTETDWTYISHQLDLLYDTMDKGIEFGNLKVTSDLTEKTAQFSKFAEKLEAIFSLCSDGTMDRISSYFDKTILNLKEDDCSHVLGRLDQCLTNFAQLDNWYAFRNLLSELEDYQAISYLHCIIKENIDPKYITKAYGKQFYFQWIDNIVSGTPDLASFNRVSQDNAVNTFIENDRDHFIVNRAIIKSKLSSQRPSFNSTIPRGSPMALLLAEREKKRRQRSIRSLLVEAGELIQQIKPCFMMSPLSVSTYLEADAVHFDLVVFDEASQIFPQDAIGSIYRAQQMIVVGDTQQLPPTSFFMADSDNVDLDEEHDDIRDYESILDICASFMQQRYLSWHYRSRHEQLIAFSNKNFYNDRLTTFPSSCADKEGIGIDYHHVDGNYANQVNLKEAEFAVDRIYDHIDNYPQRSLGVVTFNSKQQELIDRILLKRRENKPEKEYFFNRNKDEPFFIKNLETVQGDERDTILLCTTFGKDLQGRLSHNFGPLNRTGGERRLNVAVTRAKINVQVVSSMRYTDLDITRSKSEGVKLIREYLDFAENGAIALERSLKVNSSEQFDSEFEIEVHDYLVSKGFSVDSQVGCSGYRLDLALKQPESSDYVLAIECDGASYHSSRNARDRDRLRQEVLEGMGWKFHRIWSTDWFRNRINEQERLLTAAINAIGDVSQDESVEISDHPKEPTNNAFEEVVPIERFEFEPYREAEVFYSVLDYYPNRFLGFLRAVLEVEAPLSEEYFLRRMLPYLGRERLTKAVRAQFNADVRGHQHHGIIRKDGFLYLADDKDVKFRNADVVRREIKHIAPEELAAGIMTILEQNHKADKSGVYSVLAQQCGVTRCTNVTTEIFDSALSTVEDRISIDGDQLSLIQHE